LYISRRDTFDEKKNRAFCVWLLFWSVGGSVVKEKAMPINLVGNLYLNFKNQAFDFLLVLYNAPRAGRNLVSAIPMSRFILRPTTNTSLLKSLNQGIIATSKSYYSRCTFDTILDEVGKEIFVGDGECCKNVNRTKYVTAY
jgi:hypothetical protein